MDYQEKIAKQREYQERARLKQLAKMNDPAQQKIRQEKERAKIIERQQKQSNIIKAKSTIKTHGLKGRLPTDLEKRLQKNSLQLVAYAVY